MRPFPCLALTLLAASSCTAPQATGPNAPGYTGRTTVIGSHSTVAGDAEATDQQQKWPVGRER